MTKTYKKIKEYDFVVTNGDQITYEIRKWCKTTGYPVYTLSEKIYGDIYTIRNRIYQNNWKQFECDKINKETGLNLKVEVDSQTKS